MVLPLPDEATEITPKWCYRIDLKSKIIRIDLVVELLLGEEGRRRN